MHWQKFNYLDGVMTKIEVSQYRGGHLWGEVSEFRRPHVGRSGSVHRRPTVRRGVSVQRRLHTQGRDSALTCCIAWWHEGEVVRDPSWGGESQSGVNLLRVENFCLLFGACFFQEIFEPHGVVHPLDQAHSVHTSIIKCLSLTRIFFWKKQRIKAQEALVLHFSTIFRFQEDLYLFDGMTKVFDLITTNVLCKLCGYMMIGLTL